MNDVGTTRCVIGDLLRAEFQGMGLNDRREAARGILNILSLPGREMTFGQCYLAYACVLAAHGVPLAKLAPAISLIGESVPDQKMNEEQRAYFLVPFIDLITKGSAI